MKTIQHIQTGRSGQALVEFTFILLLLTALLFGLIDFGRFIYQRQIVVNLTREGANLALRNTPLSTAATSIINSASPLSLYANGRVIVSTLVNSNGIVSVSTQVSTGQLNTAVSKIGTVGRTATMPATPTKIPLAGQTLYTAEVYYTFTPITPIGKLLSSALPATVYDAAYF